MAPLCPQAVCAPQQESEQETFLRTLLHDDRNSFYVLSTDEGGRWEDVPVRRAQLAALPLGMGAQDSAASYYITHNGFADRRRKLESCRQVNAMFFDLDCHGEPGFECRRLVDEAHRLVVAAANAGTLPRPTMVVDSGRGLHLYYVLERSIPCRLRAGGSMQPNEKALAYFRDVQLRLADVLDEVLAGLDGVDVDRAVFDCTRVSRIPGTYNAKAGRRARLLSADGGYCELGDLAKYRPRAAATGPSAGAAPDGQPQRTPAGTLVRFDRLMASRLRKVAELQEHRGYACEGNRELMCFVYYNTAVQLYERPEAFRRLGAFNARFPHPPAGAHARRDRGHPLLHQQARRRARRGKARHPRQARRPQPAHLQPLRHRRAHPGAGRPGRRLQRAHGVQGRQVSRHGARLQARKRSSGRGFRRTCSGRSLSRKPGKRCLHPRPAAARRLPKGARRASPLRRRALHSHTICTILAPVSWG